MNNRIKTYSRGLDETNATSDATVTEELILNINKTIKQYSGLQLADWNIKQNEEKGYFSTLRLYNLSKVGVKFIN